MSNSRVLFLAIAFVFISNSQSYAFDGNRQGFILGLGAGFGSLSYKQEVKYLGSTGSATESKTPFVTNFKIGGAPNNQYLIYWSSKVCWFSMDNAAGGTSNMSSGTGTIAVSYYMKEKAPCPFFSGGLGYSSWSASSSGSSSTSTGLGLMLGAGYEFSPHWSGELNLSYGNPSKTENGVELTTYPTAIMLSINGMFY